MRVIEREREKQGWAKAVLTRCLDSITLIHHQLPHLSENRPSLEDLVLKLSNDREELTKGALFGSSRFGPEYCGKLNHDLTPAVTLLKYGVYYIEESPPIQGLRAVATTIRHLLGSVGVEFGAHASQVDLSQLTEEAISYFESIDEVLETPEDKKSQIKFISHLEPRRWLAFAQEDALFRILYNLATNSRKAIRYKHGKQGTGGEIKFSAREQGNFISLAIEDNGAGFRGFFPAMEEIPLPEVLKHGEGISRFKEAGFGGTGSGLGICQHLADLIGAEIFITNPEKIEGARVSIKLPIQESISEV